MAARPAPSTRLRALQRELRAAASPARARVSQSFFRTGPGEYGAGDLFLGVPVPDQRAVVRRHRDLPRRDVDWLLRSPYHEERLTALLILVEQYRRAEDAERDSIHRFYLARLRHVNNWDLVDLTAPVLIGAHLRGRNTTLLDRLAGSPDLWRRRIAMLGTADAIRCGDPQPALRIAHRLLHDPHALIHKAVGWMLREVGKRCGPAHLREFLDRHAAEMPRTMLRYAIERLPERERQAYLQRGGRRRPAGN
jgi:3-methyladenine DNA glycosylase AlkD